MHEPHELALLFPPMTPDEREELKRGIAENGQIDPITLYENRVLDGIHRQSICAEIGIKPRYEQFDGTNALAFVVSKNLHRRHLSASQRAAVAVDLLPHLKKRSGRPPGEVARTRATSSPGKAATEAAKAVGASTRSVETAKRIKQYDDKHDTNLLGDVRDGKTSLKSAEEKVKAKAPPRSQNWNGKSNPKRQREIRDQKRNGDYNKLLSLQLEMTRQCVVIEAYAPEDFGLDDATMALIDSFHDDLITLASWVDRGLAATQAWLTDVRVREKIKSLRDTTGRTAQETETALRLADKLERKLQARLVA